MPEISASQQCNLFLYRQFRESILHLKRSQWRVLPTHDHHAVLSTLMKQSGYYVVEEDSQRNQSSNRARQFRSAKEVAMQYDLL